jgi:ABC-type sugar transport system permease subunit
VLSGLALYAVVERMRWQRFHQDYRAVNEVLRVQRAWWSAGLTDIGIPFVPPGFGSFASLVMAYEYANVPLYVLLTLPAMSILRHEWREAAEVASANNWQFWRHVGAPILAPLER